jgi:hypothetical protein
MTVGSLLAAEHALHWPVMFSSLPQFAQRLIQLAFR